MRQIIEKMKAHFGFEKTVELSQPRNESEYRTMHQTALKLYEEREELQQKLNAANMRISVLEGREAAYRAIAGV